MWEINTSYKITRQKQVLKVEKKLVMMSVYKLLQLVYPNNSFTRNENFKTRKKRKQNIK